MPIVVEYNNHPRVALSTHIRNRLSAAEKDYVVHPQIKDLLDTLMIDRPLWEFRLDDTDWNGTVTSFSIMENGEMLGSVSRNYSRNAYGFRITNERIAAQRTKARGYSTSDRDKALKAIKKMFYGKTLNESVQEMREQITYQVESMGRSKLREVTMNKNPIDNAARAFVWETAWQAFVESNQGRGVERQIAEYDRAKAESEHVNELQREISNNKAYLVRRNGSAYTVVRGNDVVVHTDETLPENMKAPLGMLKLVAVNQFITNVGMRTGENDFALFNQETEDDKENQ